MRYHKSKKICKRKDLITLNTFEILGNSCCKIINSRRSSTQNTSETVPKTLLHSSLAFTNDYHSNDTGRFPFFFFFFFEINFLHMNCGLRNAVEQRLNPHYDEVPDLRGDCIGGALRFATSNTGSRGSFGFGY